MNKVADTVLDFGRPLLEAMGKPRNLGDLRSALDLVAMCWNLPTLQRTGKPEVAAMRRDFDAKIAAMPEPVRSPLVELLARREREFESAPFLVHVEVRGTSVDSCRIHAEARQLPPRA